MSINHFLNLFCLIKAEKQLATEKEELRNTMRRMEQEKTELHNRILVTEELSKKEAAQLEAQTLEFIGKVNAMEAEKNALRLLVEENENKAKQATAAVAEQLSRERDELRMRMENMEIEKSQLADGLASTEAMAKQHAADLANQLASEKAELRESLERMEREKIELALHLKLSEAAAKEQVEYILIIIVFFSSNFISQLISHSRCKGCGFS